MAAFSQQLKPHKRCIGFHLYTDTLLYGCPVGLTQIQKPQQECESHNTIHKPQQKLSRRMDEERETLSRIDVSLTSQTFKFIWPSIRT